LDIFIQHYITDTGWIPAVINPYNIPFWFLRVFFLIICVPNLVFNLLCFKPNGVSIWRVPATHIQLSYTLKHRNDIVGKQYLHVFYVHTCKLHLRIVKNPPNKSEYSKSVFFFLVASSMNLVLHGEKYWLPTWLLRKIFK
jgi:hypothetical protein